MNPYYQDDSATVLHGDCLALMAEMPDASFDAVVTDPPYGLGFMGKEWDDLPPGIEWATECLRVLKPGGHLLAFGGSRTWHRLACAVEDAGFEIRDSIAWLFGSGLPKSKNLHGEWEGWGTALKPGFEPIVMARKPLIGTTTANVSAYGTGALHIDACRTISSPDDQRGRWPSNVALDESQREALDAQPGRAEGGGRGAVRRSGVASGYSGGWGPSVTEYAYDKTDARRSKFFPVFRFESRAKWSGRPSYVTSEGNTVTHPTVKPLALMQWLIRLVTPPGGHILEPFAGSGTTVEAALRERVRVTAMEREADYLPLILHRIERHEDAPEPEPSLFDLERPA